MTVEELAKEIRDAKQNFYTLEDQCAFILSRFHILRIEDFRNTIIAEADMAFASGMAYATGSHKDFVQTHYSREKYIRELENRLNVLIDPMKQCYLDEGQGDHLLPDTCVFDNGEPIENCCFARKLLADGKTRNNCQYWRKK